MERQSEIHHNDSFPFTTREDVAERIGEGVLAAFDQAVMTYPEMTVDQIVKYAMAEAPLHIKDETQLEEGEPALISADQSI